ncbi:MAG: YeeE/YedE family protein [Nitrospiraceae bacterium]|nr:YeeE/YedE family protein [Nitrospiraceae bacterium]
MSEGIGETVKECYKGFFQEHWSATVCGIVVALLSIMIFAWARPWGAVGAVRNWGQWILYGLHIHLFNEGKPASILVSSGSVIGLGFVAGAFISACLGGEFAIRIPPGLELVKAVFAGTFMGIGSAMSGGCNVGGFYNALGNLSASGFCMMAGIIIGAIIAVKYLYWEMDHISWGSGGAKTIAFPMPVQVILGIGTIAVLIWGANVYAGSDKDSIVRLSGILLISSAIGYTMQRGRWCMIQGFREPHLSGDARMAKSIAISIAILAAGCAVLKYTGLRETIWYVRGFFGWGAIVGGIIFGFGGVIAGGCGSGALWRMGEGQIKLWLVGLFFGLSNAIFDGWFKFHDWEGMHAWLDDGTTNAGKFGHFVYMPDTWLGYGGSLALILIVMALWYIIVSWNEKSEKLVVPM